MNTSTTTHCAADPLGGRSDHRSMPTRLAPPEQPAAVASAEPLLASNDLFTASPGSDRQASPAGDAAGLAERVARLQRTVVTLTVVGCLHVGALLYWVVLQPSASLQASPDRLAVMDSSGDPRAQLHLSSNAPILQLTDDDGVSRLALGLRFDGSPLLEFNDAQGRSRVRLTMDDEGNPDLTIRDARGDTTLALQ